MSSAGVVDPLLPRAWQEVPEGIMVLDAAQWRVAHVNEAGAAVFGLTPADLLGRTLGGIFAQAVGSPLHEQLRRTRSEDTVVDWTGPVAGTGRWIQVRARHLDGQVFCAYRDVTREHALQLERDCLTDSLQTSLEQTRQLLQLCEALTATETVRDVAAVVVEAANSVFGAAYATLSVVDHERGLLRTPFTGPPAVGAVGQWADLALDAPGPGTLALREGHPRFDDAQSLRTNFPDLDHRRDTAHVRYTASVPLLAAGCPVGLLTMRWQQDLELSDAHRALLVSFASYTTQALQRALLLAERTATARTLQDSMLTTDLPQAGGLELLARYVAASAGEQVGGDWYDGVQLPDGTTLVVIGDVSGHDIAAAAEMGRLRIALRALAVDRDDPPAQLLARLESVVSSLGGEPILASCVVARVEQSPEQFDAGLRLLRWANAGHPPPLLVLADGSARVLAPAPELLLGVGDGTPRTDHVVEVPSGATLLLYTDGLVERRGEDLEDGIERLRTAGEVLAGAELGAAVDALLAAVGTDGGDDVAVLAVRFHPQDRPHP
ncbi:MAG: SpoIIE family protein phosphatase [Janthinobacterium lividum]